MYYILICQEGREDVVEYFLAKANLQPNRTQTRANILSSGSESIAR